jgi:hypothetical protein
MDEVQTIFNPDCYAPLPLIRTARILLSVDHAVFCFAVSTAEDRETPVVGHAIFQTKTSRAP